MFGLVFGFLFFFFFKQKTAYEMRISDWSSDVCSSDLVGPFDPREDDGLVLPGLDRALEVGDFAIGHGGAPTLDEAGGADLLEEIGRASCRERVCQYV